MVLPEELMLSEEPLGALMVSEELGVSFVLAAGAAAELEELLLGSAANADPPSTVASAKAGTMIFSECI